MFSLKSTYNVKRPVNFRIPPSLKTLIKTGKYTICTPDQKKDVNIQPLVITYFYLDGDLLSFVDDGNLDQLSADFKTHKEKIEAFINDVNQPFRILEIIATAFGFLLSLFFLIKSLFDFDILYIAVFLSGLFITFFKKMVIRFVAQLFMKKLTKKFFGKT